MSGVRCDDSGHILVADARAHSLKLLTSNGQFMKRARIADGGSFPYCSTFGVSPLGFLMACDRANNRMILYRIGEETTAENAILTDDVFDRIIDEAEEKKKNELRNNAKKELEDWYKQRDAALKLTKEANRYASVPLLFLMNALLRIMTTLLFLSL
ncbi:hypothetical protein ANCDUO_10317 [Ancylostoma duodenale]|uniref:Uncharacterized protein n=1 Tax=Ancylostoma duodenale TaxID=51022 RepID=A0A0C2CRL2_9BILA|nr:hypothetical protein ANCDUO_10317 [Ancylostoma duodenale]